MSSSNKMTTASLAIACCIKTRSNTVDRVQHGWPLSSPLAFRLDHLEPVSERTNHHHVAWKADPYRDIVKESIARLVSLHSPHATRPYTRGTDKRM